MRWCEEWPRKTREGEGQRVCPNLDNESKPTDSDYNHDRQFFRIQESSGAQRRNSVYLR